MKNMTELEKKVMHGINRRGEGCWSDELRYYVKDVEPFRFGGVVSSLVQKGFLTKTACEGREYLEIVE